MCTASWLFEEPARQGGGFELFFNRDESRQRQRALPPRRHRVHGVSYLAPVDTDAGGTWIAVNEYGLALALLNLYAPGEAAQLDPGYRSRGHLVTDLIASTSLGRVVARLAATAGDAGREWVYRPFRLLALAPGAGPVLHVWNGKSLERKNHPRQPLASSSYDPAGIEATRRREWRERTNGRPSRDLLLAFHRSHLPERGPYSPCMHRDDAATVSFTRVRVAADEVSMNYADGPLCEAPLAPALTLERRAEHSPDRHATLA